LVETFLKDRRFLLTSPNAYNNLGVGTTQLYDKTVVYNRKRHGDFQLGGRKFTFRVKADFPMTLTKEFLLVDLVNNLDQLAEAKNEVLERVRKRAVSFDVRRLRRAVRNYGNVRTKKFFEHALTRPTSYGLMQRKLGKLAGMAENLLLETWANLDSHELRLLLDKRIGGPGQFDGRDANPDRFYLPLARASCRVVLTFQDKKITAIEPGPAFDAAMWQKIADEIENAILVGPPKVGREYSFSSFRVPGFWRGLRSGVQILPPASQAPQAPIEMAAHPFILEFPIIGAPDDLWSITNHRRMREHRRLTLLLNVLLTARVSFESRRSEHFWAYIPAAEGTGGNGESRWLQQFFWAPLGAPVTDALSPSPPAAERLTEIEPEAYYTNVGHDGNPLRIPADLDESICRYRGLSGTNRSKFDRAAFWMDIASRQWTMSVSSSFASLVSAIESLTDRGTAHRVYCEQCQADRSHEAPGATERFRSFFETYAPGAALRKRRTQMYELRSGILHGSNLMLMDQDLHFGWDPPGSNERSFTASFGVSRASRCAIG
jgi:hypothetical protein